MKIDLDHIIFKNLGSYGNNLTEVNMQQGLNLVVGHNGAGKCVDPDTLIEVEIEEEEIFKILKAIKKTG